MLWKWQRGVQKQRNDGKCGENCPALKVGRECEVNSGGEVTSVYLQVARSFEHKGLRCLYVTLFDGSADH